MYIQNLLRLLVIFIFLFLFERPAQASHLFGGEMTYEYVGQTPGNPTQFRYRITLKHYVNCTGNDITSSMTFNYYNFNGTNSGTLIKTQIQSSTVSPPLSLPFPGTCPVTLPCLMLRTFVQLVDLPTSFNGYYVTAVASARNNDIINVDPGNLSLYMQIPPPILPNPGSSPAFTNIAMVVMFDGDTTSVQNSAFDADGDRLVYSFNTPLGFPGGSSTFTTPPQAITYKPGFSFIQPFGAGGVASINTSTGLTKFYVPTIPGNIQDRKFVISLQVQEFRNINGTDVLIGSTIRDIQLVVKSALSTANTLPVISSSSPRIITVTEGQAISPITFTFTDANVGQLLTVNAVSPLLDGPGNYNATFNGNASSTVQLTNVPSGTTATFNFTSACAEVNAFPLDIIVTDNACPPGRKIESFQIKVIKSLRQFPVTDIILPGTGINENIAANTIVGTIQTIDADPCEVHTLSLVSGIGSNDNSAFTLSPDGSLRINFVPDFETKSSYNIRVKAVDEAGQPFEKPITISVNDINEAPSVPLDSDPAVNAVPENTTTGTLTGITASSTDQEGAAITFSLTNDAGGRFAINATTGVVTVANGSLIDYETNTSHQITIQATDGALTTSQNFSIAVTDIDEIAPDMVITSTAGNPVFVSPIPITITFTENVTGFTASDILVSGGSIGNFTGSGLAYSFEIIPALTGVISVNIPAGVAMDAAGNVNVASSPFSVTYSSPNGIHEKDKAQFNLQVYPNPANGRFTVELNNTKNAHLTITDLTGKKIVSKTLANTNGKVKETVEINAAPGIYLLQIKTNEYFLIKKIILQN